jgi:hypothetical protein
VVWRSANIQERTGERYDGSSQYKEEIKRRTTDDIYEVTELLFG